MTLSLRGVSAFAVPAPAQLRSPAVRRRAFAFLVIGTLLAAASVLLLPVFLGPLALLAAVGAIWSGARRPGALLLLVAAVAMASGMLLGCVVACGR